MGESPGTVRLSVAVITFNEEKQIGPCIESFRDIADEILILDSFSTDGTEKVVRSFPGVRFEAHPFDGHVQQKNRAIAMTTGDWILSVDADERITPVLAASIRRFMEEHPRAQGARIRRLTMHMGRAMRHGGWYNARYRLLRRGEGEWAGENPHDEIILRGLPRWKHRVGNILKGDMIHYSFVDLSQQVDTINKFSSIVAFNRKGRGKRFSLLKLIYKPPVKFIEMYIIKGGFLDGIPGFVVAVASSFSAFLKWAKLYELQKTELERPSNVRPDYRVQK